MTFEQFTNALRILRNIDAYELEQVLPPERARDIWPAFRDDPADVLIRLGDREARAVYAIVERRRPKRGPAADLSRAMGGDGDLLKTFTDILRPVVPR